MNRSLHTILAVVTLPPPIHGQAIVNKAVVDALSGARVPLTVINTSPGTLQKGISYHLRRLQLNILNAVPAILNTKGGVVYTVVEPGYGMYYNFINIFFARIKHLRLVLHHHSALYTKAYQLDASIKRLCSV
jgi:hypothetical protein